MARRRSGGRESEQDGEGESAWGHRAFLGAARRLVQVRPACQGKISEAVNNVGGAGGHAGSRSGPRIPRRGAETHRIGSGGTRGGTDPPGESRGGGGLRKGWTCRPIRGPGPGGDPQ